MIIDLRHKLKQNTVEQDFENYNSKYFQTNFEKKVFKILELFQDIEL